MQATAVNRLNAELRIPHSPNEMSLKLTTVDAKRITFSPKERSLKSML